jgi:hypothetical protein
MVILLIKWKKNYTTGHLNVSLEMCKRDPPLFLYILHKEFIKFDYDNVDPVKYDDVRKGHVIMI